MTEDRILEEAISAIEHGQRSRARDLLTRILKHEPSRVDCWLYMSAVVETPKERSFCLENALKYDPENPTARQGLVMLGKLAPDERRVLVRPHNERPAEEVHIHQPEPEAQPGTRLKRKRSPGNQVVTMIAVGAAATILIIIGIFGNPFAPGGGLFSGLGASTATFAPLAAAQRETPTRHVTVTPTPEETVSSVILPTPLTIRVEEAYTPTPMYVNTPHPNNEAFSAALSSMRFENYGQALSLFEQARAQMKDNGESDLDLKYYIGITYLMLGEYEDARREFDQILQQDKNFAAAYAGRAQAILSMKADALVSQDLYKAVGIDPEYLEGYLLIAAYRLGRDEPNDALWACDQALEIDPDNARALHYMAEAYLALGDYEEALDAARRAFARDMTMEDHYYTLGKALIENGQEQEAYGYMELFMRDRENQENHFALYYYGRAFQGLNDHLRAIQQFEESYALKRSLYEMSYYWAVSLVAIGEYEDALDRVIVPIEQIPDWFEPFVVQAQAYYYMEDYFEAKESIEAGAKFAKTDLQEAELYYWRGLIYEDLGYPLISKTNWEKLLEMDPEDVPPAYLREAQKRLLPEAPTYTPAAPTPTRVSTATPKP